MYLPASPPCAASTTTINCSPESLNELKVKIVVNNTKANKPFTVRLKNDDFD